MNHQSDENYERFVKLFSKHEPHLRSFLRSMLYSWSDVEEVMQNTSLVLWRKFSDFEEGSNYMAWACTVARFEVLAFRRSKAKDPHVFSEELLENLASAAQQHLEESGSAEREALQICLEKLPEPLKKTILSAYEPGVKINEVAREIGKSANAFYKTLNRIRAALLNCINEQVAREKL